MYTQAHAHIALLLTIAWLAPLASAAVCALAPVWTHRLSRWPAWGSLAGIAVSTVACLLARDTAEGSNKDLNATSGGGRYYELAHFGDIHLSIEYWIDPVTIAMFLLIAIVSLCVTVYASRYLDDELTEDYIDDEAPGLAEVHRPGRYSRFFAYLSFFEFAMFGLVLAGNLFQTFVFWELVGASSYLLIGFYHERPSANFAATKAFVMNRVGDAGFIVALAILLGTTGTLRLRSWDGTPGLLEWVHTHGMTPPLVLAGLGLLLASLSKSAQFPLQTWLRDAMAGPTPVSALVHSATMVAAGIYLLARCQPLLSTEVLLIAAYLGAATTLIGGAMAVVATDLKQALADSTVSQLGYMLLAVGLAAPSLGLFHLVTHAVLKALLFLSAGSVIIACHHEQRLAALGGLRRKLPWSAGLMLVGVLSISGLAIPTFGWSDEPLALAGYYSKDAILTQSLAFGQVNPQHGLLYAVPLITASLTALSMFRLWFLVFAGDPREPELFEQAHESPRAMLAPMLLLAAGTAFIAYGGLHSHLFHWLQAGSPELHTQATAYRWPDLDVFQGAQATAGQHAFAAALTGVGLAILLFGIRWIDPQEIARVSGGVTRFLNSGWQLDACYRYAVVGPVHVLAGAVRYIDERWIDAAIQVVVDRCLAAARWDRQIEEHVINDSVRGLERWTWKLSDWARRLQNGHLRHYVMWIGVSVVVLYYGVVLLTWNARGALPRPSQGVSGTNTTWAGESLARARHKDSLISGLG